MLNRELLCSIPNSMLEAKFSGRHPIEKKNGKVYINRNPTSFEYLVDYLRNPKKLPKLENKYQLDKLYNELEYWGLRSTHQIELEKLLKVDPSYIDPNTLS